MQFQVARDAPLDPRQLTLSAAIETIGFRVLTPTAADILEARNFVAGKRISSSFKWLRWLGLLLLQCVAMAGTVTLTAAVFRCVLLHVFGKGSPRTRALRDVSVRFLAFLYDDELTHVAARYLPQQDSLKMWIGVTQMLASALLYPHTRACT